MKLGIVGGGAWGTALAQALATAEPGSPVRLWAREPEVVQAIGRDRVNPLFLPGVPLSPAIAPTDLLEDMADRDALLIVVPAQHLRGILAGLPTGDRPLILCAKGIEAGSGRLMSEVARDVRPDAPVAVLSGPTFAHEVARGLPTAVTLAAQDGALAERLAARIAGPGLRPYVSTDVIGAEIGGAVKNVLAIGCGVVEGAGLGQNARAALIARGFAEMSRFGVARGARMETLTGLSGLGDLVLTCNSTASRNFSLGKAIGEGGRAADLLADRRSVAEGAFTAPVLVEAAREAGVDMPVAAAVDRLIAGRADARAVIAELLARPLRGE